MEWLKPCLVPTAASLTQCFKILKKAQFGEVDIGTSEPCFKVRKIGTDLKFIVFFELPQIKMPDFPIFSSVAFDY